MQICIACEALHNVVPYTIMSRSVMVAHTTTCIALVAFKDVTLMPICDAPVVHMELVETIIVGSTSAHHAYIVLVLTSLYIVMVVAETILYRGIQVRGPPYKIVNKKK